MNHFIVDGKKEVSPSGSKLSDVVQYIYQEYSNDHKLVSSVLVDGIELNEKNEKDLSALPLDQIRSVEVLTSTPQDVASETLSVLVDFLDHLMKLSLSLSQEVGTDGFHPRFTSLVTGLETTVQTLTTVKSVFRAGLNQVVNLLEVDLHSVLKDMLSFYQEKQNEFLIDILANHLPTNLKEWKEKGIPQMMRSYSAKSPVSDLP